MKNLKRHRRIKRRLLNQKRGTWHGKSVVYHLREYFRLQGLDMDKIYGEGNW